MSAFGVFTCATCVMLHQLLHGVKLGSCGDVIATVVQFADLIVLNVVSLVVVPVTNRQRVSTCEEDEQGKNKGVDKKKQREGER